MGVKKEMTGTLIDGGVIGLAEFLSTVCAIIVSIAGFASIMFLLLGMTEFCVKALLTAFGGAMGLGVFGISESILDAGKSVGRATANAGIAVADVAESAFNFLTGGGF